MLHKFESFLLVLVFLFLPSQLALHLWPMWTTIAGSRVDYLSPTLYFSDLLISCILLLNFLQTQKKTFNFLRTSASFAQLSTFNWVVMLSLTTNVLFSLHPILTLYKIVRLMLYAKFAVYLYTTRESSRRLFFTVLPYTVLWVSLLAIAQFYFQSHLGGLFYWLGERPLSPLMQNVAKVSLPNLGIWLRPYATFPHPNALAGFLLVSLFLRPRLNRFVYFISTIALMLTFSRSAIIIFVLFVILQFRSRMTKIILVCTLLLSSIYYLRSSNLLTSSSFTERLNLNIVAIQSIKRFPIFGTGLGTFPFYSTTNYQPAHNLYLLLISELGLPTVMCLGYWIFLKFKYLLAIGNWKLVIASLSILLTGLLDHYWLTSPQNLLFVFIIMAVLIATPSLDTKQIIIND